MPLLTGYAQWWEVVVIFIGLAPVPPSRSFVFPGHMVSLIVGMLMVLVGLMLTFVGQGAGRHARLAAEPASRRGTGSRTG